MFDKIFTRPPPLSGTVQLMLTIWCLLLVLGATPGLMLTGMAFEGGNTFAAYYSVVVVWLYPALVVVSYFFRRKKADAGLAANGTGDIVAAVDGNQLAEVVRIRSTRPPWSRNG